jgi:hypothetical protein
MPGVASPHIHAGIVLTVTGVSRCISLDAYTAVSLLPLVAGTGAAVALDAPVVAEACGLGNIVAEEDVDVKVIGRGLYYSQPGLEKGLAEIAVRLYAEGEDAVSLGRLGPGSLDPRYPLEAVEASLRGSTGVLAGYGFPLNDLQGYWGVVVRLRKRLRMRKVVEAVYTGLVDAETIIADVIDLGVEGLAAAGLRLAGIAGASAQRLIRRVLRGGAEAAFIDYTGRLLVAVAEDETTVSILSSKLRGLGDRLEAAIVV